MIFFEKLAVFFHKNGRWISAGFMLGVFIFLGWMSSYEVAVQNRVYADALLGSKKTLAPRYQRFSLSERSGRLTQAIAESRKEKVEQELSEIKEIERAAVFETKEAVVGWNFADAPLVVVRLWFRKGARPSRLELKRIRALSANRLDVSQNSIGIVISSARDEAFGEQGMPEIPAEVKRLMKVN